MLDRVELPESEVDWLLNSTERRQLERGDVFCGIGQTYYEVGVLEEGILVVYEITLEGEKVVLDFHFPGSVVLALTNAVKRRPCEVSIEVVARAVVRVWPFDLRVTARTRHPEWATLEAQLFEEAFVRKQDRYHSLSTLDAKERYMAIDREFPSHWRRIPQHLLAAYLNITPQHLSRLKRASERSNTGLARRNIA